MGNSTEDGKNVKAEKSPPPPLSVYGPWSVTTPPYLNSGVASSPSASHYMWAPPLQSMIPHAAAFYAHYAHCVVPPVGNASSVESAKNTDGGVSKKLKASDGLSMSIGNGNFDMNGHESSESEPNVGSTDGSNGTFTGASKAGREENRHRSPKNDVDAPNHRLTSVANGDVLNKATVDVIQLDDALETKIEIGEMNLIPSDASLQKEREMKRERRKQSNRESARRSRLRKQVEAEELANKVHQLTCDNLNFKAEMNKLMECSAKLKLQNAVLMEKIKYSDSYIEETDHNQRVKPVATMNLLARVNNSSSNDDRDSDNEQAAVYEGRSTAKLHQLLDANSLRSDAVAAS